MRRFVSGGVAACALLGAAHATPVADALDRPALMVRQPARSVLLGAVALAAASNSAAERDYRRSQALALAEAGVAEARAGERPHGPRALGHGRYAWRREAGLIIARGEVEAVNGAWVTRTVRARLAGSKIVAWEEGP